MKFTWSEEYNVGVELINSQHKRFFEIANSIIDLTSTEFEKKDLLNHVNNLGDYAFYHLNTEEEYFQKFNYEDSVPHVRSHDRFREKIQGYFNMARDEKTDVKKLASEVADYAIDWLKNHILIMDKKYSQCFKEHGLE